MPNWCNNFATFTCPSQDIYDKLLLSLKENNWFETFVDYELDKKSCNNNFGIAINNFGTKWTPCNIEIVNTYEEKLILEVSYSTAWTPPTKVYKKMNKEFNIVIDAFYEEIGNEFFGRCFYENGEEVDDVYNYPSNLEELTELRKIIGSELDDYMTSRWEQLQDDWNNEDDESDD